ncbi:MAG: DUF3768 domain-containing protein [Pseudomonadota bacterium]
MGILQDDIEGDVGSVPICQNCASECVVRDAWANWNPETGLWELETVCDAAFCKACEQETKLKWVRQEAPPNRRIRELNDRFRRKGLGNGSVFVTSGVQGQGAEFVLAAVEAVRMFDGFSEDNDPWGEHDFGAVAVNGEKVFFKIDYYDPSLEAGSANPPKVGAFFRTG